MEPETDRSKTKHCVVCSLAVRIAKEEDLADYIAFIADRDKHLYQQRRFELRSYRGNESGLHRDVSHQLLQYGCQI